MEVFQSHTTRSPKAEAGFTLLEVLMALAILGGGMFMLLQSHLATMNLFSDTQEAALVELLSQQGTAIAEVEILSGKVSGEGNFGESLADYTYAYQAVLLDELETPGLLDVTFTLYGPLEDREFQFRVYDGVQIEEGDAQNVK